MQEYDLNHYPYPIPSVVRKAVIAAAQHCDVILYIFHHWSNGKRIEHGWILTYGADNNHRLINTWVTNRCWWRGHDLLEYVRKYISNGPNDVLDDPVVTPAGEVLLEQLFGGEDQTHPCHCGAD
jgi:hypothetical protein